MDAMASQITNFTIVYSMVYLGTNQTKQLSSASLAIVRGIHRWPVNFPLKWPVTWKMFPFDDVIMMYIYIYYHVFVRQLVHGYFLKAQDYSGLIIWYVSYYMSAI